MISAAILSNTKVLDNRTGFTGSGSGASAFSAITSGTNTVAAMIVGSGASFVASGTGVISATSVPVSGVTSLTFTGTTTKAVSAIAAGTSGNCAQWVAGGNLGDAGSPCGSGGSTITVASPYLVIAGVKYITMDGMYQATLPNF